MEIESMPSNTLSMNFRNSFRLYRTTWWGNCWVTSSKSESNSMWPNSEGFVGCLCYLPAFQEFLLHLLQCNEWGEPTSSYRPTGWVWETTGWKFKTAGNLLIVVEESIEYTSNQQRKAKRSQTCNWLDLGTLGFKQLCSKAPQTLLQSNINVLDS